ncbi:hypothetical protein [Engelhardtia mirabilis]|uniref:FlgN protein n=1 Tax=Engelhardtia mirabilis TaxID=2528011 RepID=A0A518BSY7_9BACT|nr:hypothetical protein Pla133_52020 [Planctomycetes bacterium Pla133]QDV04404.1 hypothetical protein Pla86_51990 [Planctomycetes bacterium Pla86]
MTWQAWLRKAESWAQEEQGAQLRLLEALREHEASLSGGDPGEIERTLGLIRDAISGENQRARRRREWLGGLGSAWGVEPLTLTLRSVVERAGEAGGLLSRQRTDLEATTRLVVETARRVSLIARQQRAVVGEILTMFTGVDPTVGGDSRGALVHLEA